jgi:hypothetical protein
VPEIVIFSWDLQNGFVQRPQHLPTPSYPVRVTLTPDPAIMQTVARDSLLYQQIVDAIKSVFDQAAMSINNQLLSADRQIPGATAQQARQIVDAFEQQARSIVSNAERQAAGKAAQKWAELKAQRVEYRNYQVKCGVKVGLGALGVGVAAAGVAGAAFTGGASLAVAIVVSARSILDGVKTLNNLCREAETIGKRVTVALVHLAERHGRGSSRAGATAKEMLGTVVSSVIILEPNSLKNIPKAKADCDLWQKKLYGIRISAHELSKELNELLDASSELERKLLNPRPGSNEEKLNAALEKLRREIMALLGDESGPVAAQRAQAGMKGKWARLTTSSSIAYEHARAEEGLRAQKAAADALAALEKRSPGWVKYFDQFFPIAVNLGLGYSAASAPSAVLDAVALGGAVGVDIDNLAVEFLDMGGFFSASEEISNLASGGASGPAVSAPVLTGTTADLGAMNLRPINAAPQPPVPQRPAPPNTPQPQKWVRASPKKP